MLYLVRHGRPIVDAATPASTWELDPAGFDDVWALRDRLPQGGAWYCSPEPKATQTAQLLTDHDVGIVDGLREQVRGAGWVDDFGAAVARALAAPDEPAVPGWEPLGVCRDRVVAAVDPILRTHGGADVVLVGHATAWTVLQAWLESTEPDVRAWSRWRLPDVVEVTAT